MIKTNEKIDFKSFSSSDRRIYNDFLFKSSEVGCEYSFANLYLWGRQSFAEIYGHIVIFSQFDRRTVYPYPLGNGDKKAVLDAIISDSKVRGIPCRITGLTADASDTIEKLYPGKFRFHCDRDSYDYVYDIKEKNTTERKII